LLITLIKVFHNTGCYNNQSSGLVEETSDVEFDETNGSQEEQENLDDIGNEGLRIAMKNMTIGDVKPKDEDDDDPSTLF
jgi:hypothetical protein